MRYLLVILLLFLFHHFPSTLGYSKTIKRDILAIWDSSEYLDPAPDSDYTRIHLHAEAVLNHFGMKLEYVDIANGIPQKLYQEKYMRKFRAILSWFEDISMRDPITYITWLKDQVKKKRKIIILGNLGAYVDNRKKLPERKTTDEEKKRKNKKGLVYMEHPFQRRVVSMEMINSFFKLLGFRRYDKYFSNTYFMKILKQNVKYTEFERTLKDEIVGFHKIKNISRKNKVYLRVWQENEEESESDVIVTGPKGSYAGDPFILHINEQDYDQSQWRINPFLFFPEALGLQKGMPIPDITTLNGKRLFYIHIDGDGFSSIYEQDRISFAAEVLLKNIFSVYPFLTTVSVITAEIDPKIYGNRALVHLAKKIYLQPNIEIGNHTLTHPLIWEKSLLESGEVREAFKEFASKNYLGFKVGDYTLDYETEIYNSTKFINENLSDGKKRVKVFQWSGNCRPPEEAVKLTAQLGLLNINGGDSRFDRNQPSYSSIAPLYKRLGDYYQIYSTNSNENIYTNLWMGPFSGFENVIETFENTESPIRIRPVNIYYHFYSGAKISAIKALEKVYDWSQEQDLFSIFTSRYLRIVHGFIDTKIEKLKKETFKLSNFQPLRTFRFENETRFPNMKVSRNVIGWKHFQDSLYVFLGSDPIAKIKLTKKEPKVAYISNSLAHIQKLLHKKNDVHITLNQNLDSETTVGNLRKNQTYQITISSSNKSKTLLKTTGDEGELNFKIEGFGNFKVLISSESSH